MLRPSFRAAVSVFAFVTGACVASGTPDIVPPDARTEPASPPAQDASHSSAHTLTAEALRPHVEFLADDAQGGRAPGTEDDTRVQAYIETHMREAGLEPGFAEGYRQPFDVTDGVRLRARSHSAFTLGGKPVEHAIVPFSGAGQASGKLVFVGYGIAPEGKDSGDYKGLARKIEGAIVVALDGTPPEDPHVSPVHARPQQKLINARDHGAVGFVLWEPNSDRAWPNHGEASDLQIPAVWAGKAATKTLQRAFGSKATSGGPGELGLAPGATSRAPATIDAPIEPIVRATANVAGRLPGNGASSRVIVVGAHMDHLGMGTSHSLAPGEQAVHNGADDNASGVAVVLELARALAAVDRSKRPFDVVFVAFGAEEMGLIGSKRYVRALGEQASTRIAAMLNFDMVGRLGPDGLVIAGTGTSKRWPDLIEEAAGGLTVRLSEDGYGPSDHGSFYEAGIPVLHFFTGPHEDYHKPSDDTDKIDFDGAAKVGNVALAIVQRLQREAIEPDYVKVARKETARGGFRVSLGTIPDYGANVDGVRLSGVRDGGPAAAAGLVKGDVIVQLGPREIHNLDDYMAAFAVIEPGKPIDVVVMRDGQRVVLEMTPAAPQRR